MKFILIPVKDLSKANNRLSSILSQEDRTSLAYAMLEDVLESAARSRIAEKKVVVTMDRKAEIIALRYGFEIIREEEQNGESSSVDSAITRCMEMGAESLLVIPGDAPLIKGEDIDSVFRAEKNGVCVVMVPAADRLGTNAILRTPPDIIPSRFGHDSYRKHLEEAGKADAEVVTIDIPNIALDIDEPGDIDLFINRGQDTRTYRELLRLGIPDVRIERTA